MIVVFHYDDDPWIVDQWYALTHAFGFTGYMYKCPEDFTPYRYVTRIDDLSTLTGRFIKPDRAGEVTLSALVPQADDVLFFGPDHEAAVWPVAFDLSVSIPIAGDTNLYSFIAGAIIANHYG